MKKCLFLVCLIAGLSLSGTVVAQGLLKKLKDKVINKTVDKEVEKKTGTSENSPNDNSNTNNSGKPTNKGGAGLTNTEPPDVKIQMAEAETAHGSKNYSDARYS